MANINDDDKPTVVLDLNALKKEKLKKEEELANMASDLEFNVFQEEETPLQDSATSKADFDIILFDFQSDFFQKSLEHFPKGFHYHIVTSLNGLNQFLKTKKFQIVVFHYDAHPKAVNQLCAQIKQKIPSTKTIIMAKNISPQKALAHAKTPSGANGYSQLPIQAEKLEKEFLSLEAQEKKAG
jgi:hypothetical protein